MLMLDHLVIAAETLDEGVSYVEKTLGLPLDPGGQHLFMGTHNRVLSLGPDVYLEVIAIDPNLSHPGRERWFGLDGFEGPPRLVTHVLAAPDLARQAALSNTHLAPERLQRGDFVWHMALPRHEHVPPVLYWPGVRPQDRLEDKGVRVLRLTAPPSGLDVSDPLIEAGDDWSALLSTPNGQVRL